MKMRNAEHNGYDQDRDRPVEVGEKLLERALQDASRHELLQEAVNHVEPEVKDVVGRREVGHVRKQTKGSLIR